MAYQMASALPVFVVLVVGKAVAVPPHDKCGQVCDIYCPNGYVLDDRGCPTCECIEGCVPAVCPTIKCAYGLQRDENGCEICACNPRPQCPLVKCRPCANDYIYINGCQTCACKPGCVPAVCPTIKCAYGLQRDENGCEICACNPRPHQCPLVNCRPCANGYVYINDCQTCTCKPSCVPAVCPTIKCAYGLQRDMNGCEICACNPRPQCPLVNCRPCANGYIYMNDCQTCACKPGCVPAVCPTIKCAYGLQRDVNGCEICACNPMPPPDKCGQVCDIYCPNGYVLDERGCPTCQCIEGCVPAVCPTIKCAYGLQRDENDCEICACNPRPQCPLVNCRPCANGYIYINGCQTCACKPGCVPAVCPTIKCAYGRQRDMNGCEICACNPRPGCPLVKCRECANSYIDIDGCLTCDC